MASSLDPTKTTTLRRRFETQIRKRILALRKAIVKWVGTDDELGLEPVSLALNVRKFEFATNDAKLDAFKLWLQGEVDAGLLATNGVEPWTGEFVASAYKQGLANGYIAARPELDLEAAGFQAGSKAEFLREAFAAPEALSKVRLLSTRSYEALKGVSQTMSQNMGRILADGMASGKGPRQVAVEMSRGVEKISRQRALVISRTEIIHAHAEGQLDSFEKLGVELLGIQTEYRTVGDDRVCPLCRPFEGRVFSVKEARGIIPLHPNCRCAWLPYFPGKAEAKKVRLKALAEGKTL